jgi:protein phosphatase
VVAHAGLKEELQGRGSGKVRDFALYGETTGETDEFGLPVRYNWAAEYRGRAMVVYGHTPVPEPEWFNGTICIDTGCVFGGKLTALRYPEKELVSVPALETYYEPSKPFPAGRRQAAGVHGTATVRRRSRHRRRFREADRFDAPASHGDGSRGEQHRGIGSDEQVRGGSEVAHLFAADDVADETSREAELLEHPAEAFSYYRIKESRALCAEEKHMGSRASVVRLPE